MPFKSLSALKKLATLDAEVVAGAALETDGVFVALTNDPVQLNIQPFGAGSAKTQSVSLDSANEVALINKSVAVIRSGGDLWGVLDVSHRPKVDQVGRDARSLIYNPAGGSAFVLGWDGQGHELKMQGHDVGERAFALRGDLRAAALSRSAMHTAVDGQGGGQYREHPGSTPEPAASGRADLPAEAAAFSRMAGGSQLSALFKPGKSEICVIRREADGSYGAKVVLSDSPVRDLAVIESSLFVVCGDDRVRLYDGATIQGCLGDVMAPTYELSLRADGGATMLRSTTARGNRLWIGTQAGELFRCDAVKGEMKLT
jgi:hypothetical protein